MPPGGGVQILDNIVRARVLNARDEFIASISEDQICRLASSYHNGEPCHYFTEPKRGSYNICFFVAFDDGEKWVVRVPLAPCLAFDPSSKIEREVATMQVVSERTDIPIPKIVAYQLGESSKPLSSFIILEYVKGQALSMVNLDSLSNTQQEQLYISLARIYIQLRRLEFSSIGCLQRDQAGVQVSKMVMSIDINMHAVEELDPYAIRDSFYGDQNNLTSANAYTSMLLDLADNAFAKGRKSVTDSEYDGADGLYQLHLFRRHVGKWLNRSLDEGPFVLIHGDLLPYNLFVNEEMEITSVLDWEWSRIVPRQFFEPPLWLTNHFPPTLAFISVYKALYLKSFDKFLAITRMLERETYGNELLSDEWTLAKSDSGFLVANALENWTEIDYFASRCLDDMYFGKKDLEKRVWAFVDETPHLRTFIKKKLEEGIAFEKELKEMQE
ncbi:phosphotransferase enzyme family protein [Hypoxylon crocopeplum]|nr:phosphotransferase enzyme family protein [Hypoxylon crocopeplum]